MDEDTVVFSRNDTEGFYCERCVVTLSQRNTEGFHGEHRELLL